MTHEKITGLCSILDYDYENVLKLTISTGAKLRKLHYCINHDDIMTWQNETQRVTEMGLWLETHFK